MNPPANSLTSLLAAPERCRLGRRQVQSFAPGCAVIPAFGASTASAAVLEPERCLLRMPA